MKQPPGYASSASGLKSAQAVFTVLKVFAQLPFEAGLSEVVQAVCLPKMKVHRALHTLVEAGFLFQNPKSKKFRLHHSILTLARKFQSEHSIRMISHDVLQELALEIGEDITVAVLDDNRKEIVFVNRLSGGARISFFCDVGKHLPLHVGAAAKAILAHLPEDEFESYLMSFEPVKISPFTISTIGAIRKERKSILEKGYSFSNQEVDEGVSALGACILGANGYPAAGVAIAFLSVKWTDRKIEKIGARLKETLSKFSF